jgi:acyl-homoserine lactone acylase PvdQ
VAATSAEDNSCVLADDIVTLSTERSRWFGPHAGTVYGVNNLVTDFYHQQVNQSQVVEGLLSRGPSQQAREGSNAIAMGRAATVGRTGMVLANPHLPWQGDMRLYQQQLTIPGELNVSGASLYGLPVISIGHTNNLAGHHVR